MTNASAVDNASMDALMGQVADEFLDRLHKGEQPKIEDYAQRYPEIGPVLRKVLPALEVIRHSTSEFAGIDRTVSEDPRTGCLGDYRIVREIGRGGMGVVYEAEQISLGRQVALKVLPFAAALDAKQLQRFKNEAQAAAHLHHQNIVPVHGVGCERGVHYYAMQYIEGQTLAALIGELRQLLGAATPDQAVVGRDLCKSMVSGRWAPAAGQPADPEPTRVYAQVPPPAADKAAETSIKAAGRLSTVHSTKSPAFFRTVAGLGVQAAEALEHAHQHGVVHRDIKPANLLVDARGNLWITDFGLAHCQSQAGLTMTGDLVGTLRYMSPEQALAQRVLVDHRTDIYSLGATLYELLTLEPAFAGRDRQELLRQIAFEEPRPCRRLDKAIPAELETIALKAMEKNPGERYASAQELANDLERFLKDEPIRARRPTLWQRARKWARRHQAMVTTATVFTLGSLMLAVGGLLVSNFLIQRETRQKEGALAEARLNYEAAEGQRRRAEKLAEDHRQHLVRTLVAHGVRLADEGDLPASLPWFAEALDRDQEDAAAVAMHRFRLAAALQQAARPVQIWFHEGVVTHAEFSRDGRRVVTASRDGTARVWDVNTGQPVSPPLAHNTWWVYHASFNHDGRQVVTAGGDSTARVWDAVTGQPLAVLKHGFAVMHAEFSADGRHVVTAGATRDGGEAQAWDAATGKPITPPLSHRCPVKHAAFSPEGRRVVTASGRYTPPGTHDGEARVWDATTGKPLTPPLAAGTNVPVASFSPDGRRVLTAGIFGRACVWDAASGEPRVSFAGSQPAVYAAFSPNGNRVVTAGQYGTARVWDAITGKPASPELKHSSGLLRASFSPDGRRILTACADGTARVWDAVSGDPAATPLRHGGTVMAASFSPDGQRVVTASHDHTARVWDIGGGPAPAFLVTIPGFGSGQHASFSPNGLRVLTAGEDQPARVWDLATRGAVSLAHGSGIAHAAFSADGRHVLTAGYDGKARVWNASNGEPLTKPLENDGSLEHAAFSADGRFVVTASRLGTARVWSVASSEPVIPILKHGFANRVYSASFSPDGRCVVTASDAGRVWDAASGELLATLKTGFAVYEATFSLDGRRIVTACAEGTAQVWEAATGKPVTPPLRHGAPVLRASFSADGRRVVTASHDATARVWDADTGDPATPPLQHGSPVMSACFSPEGRRVVTAARDSTARVWDAATGEPLAPPLKHSDWVSDASFSPDGRRLVTACDDRTVRVWDLPFDGRPLPDLMLLVQLVSGTRFDPKGGLVRLEPAELKTAWQTLRAKYPEEFAMSGRKSGTE